MKNFCWQILLQSDAFQKWNDREKEALVNLIRCEESSENIKLSDVFPINSNKELDYSELLSTPIGTSEYVDKRIRAIKFYNFRCFRTPDDAIPYGVDFCKDKEPCSAFFVGGNGTGKSSVYSALELHYTGFCSHAKEMGCDIKDYLTYGFNRLVTIQNDDVSIGIIRQDEGEKEIKQTLNSFQPVCPSSAYCSDYDVEQIRQSGKALFVYLLRQLGYGQFEQILQRISFLQETIGRIEKSMLQNPEELNSANFNIVILNFFRSVSRSEENEKECIKECNLYIDPQAIKNKIDGWDSLPDSFFFKEQWEITRKSKIIPETSPNIGLVIKKREENVEEYDRQVGLLADLYSELLKILTYKKKLQDDSKYSDQASSLLDLAENMTKRKKELEDKDFQYIADSREDFENKKNILEKIKSLITDNQHQIILQFYNTFQKELSDVMKDFSDDRETYKMEMTSNSISLKIHVPTPEGGFDAEPYEYFNSFRFKLFCITLKITLAYYWMQANKTIVPFVIDDVFNANDFKNGLNLEYFVCKIYKWYNTKLVIEKECKIPFQLIMFTHDDMMQTAFKKGFLRSKMLVSGEVEEILKTLKILLAEEPEFDMVCARLFPSKAIEEKRKGEQIEYKKLYFDGTERAK